MAVTGLGPFPQTALIAKVMLHMKCRATASTVVGWHSQPLRHRLSFPRTTRASLELDARSLVIESRISQFFLKLSKIVDLNATATSTRKPNLSTVRGWAQRCNHKSKDQKFCAHFALVRTVAACHHRNSVTKQPAQKATPDYRAATKGSTRGKHHCDNRTYRSRFKWRAARTWLRSLLSHLRPVLSR